MSTHRDEGPVYYREIQKNAYLKRIPNEISGSKLMPLGQKKPPLKPMWTQLCVHNGHTPYLEQYPEPEHPCALGHRPVWRACLLAARHVTASVRPTNKQEYDFLVDTDNGPVRMLAPDWETMQDWVTTLRNKLAELKIVGKGENVYCAPPAAPIPRAAARDPTSPLPPTPPVPPDRVPGIDLTSTTRQAAESTQSQLTAARQTTEQPQSQPTPEIAPQSPQTPQPEPETQTIDPTPQENIDISHWDTLFTSLPSTSATKNTDKPKKVAKICGQNICLDDSIFKRTSDGTDSDDEFFRDIDSLHESMNKLDFNSDIYTQRVVVNDDKTNGSNSDRPSNITVIQVSNKDAPHTAIPIMGPETDIFDFEFKPPTTTQSSNFVNIVNTEVNVQNSNDYGTVFSKTENDYGHLSLTTTVCLSGTTNVNFTDASLTYVKSNWANLNSGQILTDVSGAANRLNKSSITSLGQLNTIPHMEPRRAPISSETNRTQNLSNNRGPVSLTDVNTTPVSVTDSNRDLNRLDNRGPVSLTETNRSLNIQDNRAPVSLTDVNMSPVTLTDVNRTQADNRGPISLTDANQTPVNVTTNMTNEGVYERLCMASTSTNRTNRPSPLPNRLKNMEKSRKASLPNLEVNDSTYEYLFPNSSRDSNSIVREPRDNNVLPRDNNVLPRDNNVIPRDNNVIPRDTNVIPRDSNVLPRDNYAIPRDNNVIPRDNNVIPRDTNVIPRDSNVLPRDNYAIPRDNNNTSQNQGLQRLLERRINGSIVERSQSQNAYDSARRESVLNSSPKRDGRCEKQEQISKPIWKRGLTELSLLTKLKGIGKRQESPSRTENEGNERTNVISPVKVMHRSRPDARIDSSRRRSNSLNNGESPPSACPRPSLQPLLARQATALRAEQRRGAALVASIHTAKSPVFADYNKQVWIASWSVPGTRWCGRCGDRLVGIRGVTPLNAQHAKQIIGATRAHTIDVLFHRVPLAKVYVVNRRDKEALGIKLDGECNIVSVEADSPASRAGIPPPGKWAVTEVNNRPINLVKGGEEEMQRLSAHGTEVLIIVQPSPLVKKLRTVLKGNKSILGLR